MAGSWSIPRCGDNPKLGDSTAPRVNAVGRTGWLRFPVPPARLAVFWGAEQPEIRSWSCLICPASLFSSFQELAIFGFTLKKDRPQ